MLESAPAALLRMKKSAPAALSDEGSLMRLRTTVIHIKNLALRADGPLSASLQDGDISKVGPCGADS